MTHRVTVAGPSQLAADAGADIAAVGGGAVDAAVAAMAVAMITEPGVCALGGGGYVTLWGDAGPVTVDGYMEMPGRGLPPDAFGGGYREVTMAYGGGITTRIGYGSVATPGGLRALAATVDAYGVVPWREVLAPAIDIARRGFPLSESAAYYLTFAADTVFSLDPAGHRALTVDGLPKRAGDIVVIDGLADSLDALAHEGVDLFYRGEMAAALAEAMEQHGGIVTRADLADYRVEYRTPIMGRHGDWTLATNPAPAIGGATLTAILELMDAGVADYVSVQEAVFGFRRRLLDREEDRSPVVARLLALARAGDLDAIRTAPSTVQVSAADRDGLACSITMSAGYGAGVMVPETGIWLNNALGELELNRNGFHKHPIGARLLSNMAPSVARQPDGASVAIGSPGADRITTALATTVMELARGRGLDDAIGAPRLHVEVDENGEPRVAAEPGADVSGCRLPIRWFEGPDMYFGGVTAAEVSPRGLHAAADPRRTGGTSSA